MRPRAFRLLHLESFFLGCLVLAAGVEFLAGGDGLHARAELVHGLHPLIVWVGIEDNATTCTVNINTDIDQGKKITHQLGDMQLGP